MSVKYIFVTGGVVSGLGKGITAASLGRLLKARGLHVTIQKFDPYINVDPGTMSPYQHGEVFVTDDGAETDLDIGHYERFIDENLDCNSNVTTGKIYWSVIEKERSGGFDGGTVQVIPHITNEIKDRIYRVGKSGYTDVVITEIGGTVGDIESLPFLEAIRQVAAEVGREHVMYIHVTLVPYLEKSGELKTKPTQHSVKELRSIGIQPDVIVCRTERELSKELKDKIGLFCNMSGDAVIQNMDSEVLYEVPLKLEKEGLARNVCKRLNMTCREPELAEWIELVEDQKKIKTWVTIALVGKYVELHDAYLSIVEALKHAGTANCSDIKINWVCSEMLCQENIEKCLSGSDGILVPGGFGNRGTEGKILAAQYARENKVPFFGISLGMQMAVLEYARNVCGMEDANSTEFCNTTAHPIFCLLPGNKEMGDSDGGMRLGSHSCKLKEGTLGAEIYGEQLIDERHRHRYGFNMKFNKRLSESGLVISGVSSEEGFVEIIELKDHPWYVGVQFHPEFKSRPNRPHPLFGDFIKASKKQKKDKEKIVGK